MRLRSLVFIVVVVALALAPALAYAAEFNVAADFTAIQNAINAANPGDTINVATGTVSLTGTQYINIPTAKLGIRLIGAGVGQTILQSDVTASGNRIMFIGQGSGAALATAPTLIEGFTFRNSAANPDAWEGVDQGIAIRANGGPSAAQPGVIRNCAFVDLADSAIVIGDTVPAPGSHQFWSVTGNTFNGCWWAFYNNSADSVAFSNNIIDDCYGGFSLDANDIAHDLTITGNTFLGGEFAPGYPAVTAVNLSPASTAEDAARGITVTNNRITDYAWGIRFRPSTAAAQSLTGVTVATNSISGLTARTSYGTAYDPVNIYNGSGKTLIAANNWWGRSTGPVAGETFGTVTTTPWLETYQDDPAKAGQPGFWPVPVAPPVVSTPASSTWSLAFIAITGVAVLALRRRGATAN